MNLKKTFATVAAAVFLFANAQAAPDSGPKPRYKTNGKGASFSNTRKVTCQGAWGTGALKRMDRTHKGPKFPGT